MTLVGSAAGYLGLRSQAMPITKTTNNAGTTTAKLPIAATAAVSAQLIEANASQNVEAFEAT